MKADRFAGQSDLVPIDELCRTSVTVIGVGAIGRQVALQLASLGIHDLQIIDFDVVEATNITSQGYRQCDLGRLKVDALSDLIIEIDSTINVDAIKDRYRATAEVGQAIFCCVDSITARDAIWRSAGRKAPFWVDGRMLGEVLRILVAEDQESRDHYPTTMFAQAEAQTGRCTARSTLYAASIAAGLMVHQFTRWLRRMPVDADCSFNLLAGEFTVAPVAALTC